MRDNNSLESLGIEFEFERYMTVLMDFRILKKKKKGHDYCWNSNHNGQFGWRGREGE